MLSKPKRIAIAFANAEDREKIYRLRHQVYAEELSQHPINTRGKLTDALDDFNCYITAKLNGEIIGFISITPPGLSFSIDKYFSRQSLPFSLDNLTYEVRLLTVVEEYRSGLLAYMLMYAAMRFVQVNGGTRIISICRTDLLEMYAKAGLNFTSVSASAGKITYTLAYGLLEDFGSVAQMKAPVFESLERKISWNLPFDFRSPNPCYHGGAFFKAIGEDLKHLERRNDIINADVLDAWFPPSPNVLEALHQDLPWLLKTSPPTQAEGLVNAIAQKRGVRAASILAGAGSSDLIYLALVQLLKRGSRVLLLDPCYGEYRHVLDHVIGCEVYRFKLKRADDYEPDLDSLFSEICMGYDMVILVNPNNPTGKEINSELLKNMLLQVPAGTLVWIDETYIDYSSSNYSLEKFAAGQTNVIICKSLSKVYALSGLRSAYLCSSPAIIERLRRFSPPWAVSLPAQLATIMALDDDAYYSQQYEKTGLLRESLSGALRQSGITEIIDGIGNFILFYLPGGLSSGEFCELCRGKNLFIRDVSNMGTTLGKGAVRIAVKDEETNNRMIAIIRSCLHELSESNPNRIQVEGELISQ